MTGVTARQWAVDFLARIMAPSYTGNVQLVVAWCLGENTKAKFNPLATTRHMPGSTDFNYNNGYAVQNFKSYEDGVVANALTVTNGRYPTIVDGFRNSSPARALSNPREWNLWGTGWANVNARYATVRNNWPNYALWVPPSLVSAPTPEPEPEPEPKGPDVVIIQTEHAQFTCDGVYWRNSTPTAIKALQAVGVPTIHMTRAEVDDAFYKAKP